MDEIYNKVTHVGEGTAAAAASMACLAVLLCLLFPAPSQLLFERLLACLLLCRWLAAEPWTPGTSRIASTAFCLLFKLCTMPISRNQVCALPEWTPAAMLAFFTSPLVSTCLSRYLSHTPSFYHGFMSMSCHVPYCGLTLCAACVADSQMYAMLNHKDSPYIRCLGFLRLRYTEDNNELFDWFETYLDDMESFSPTASGKETYEHAASWTDFVLLDS